MPSWKRVIVSGSAAALGSLNVTGGITGSSIIITGSAGTLFSSNVDTLILTGSMIVTGSSVITGSLNVTQGITGSLFGTSSWALNTATASYVNPLVQNVVITGSLNISGALNIIGNQTTIGNRYLTGSWNVTGSSNLTGNTVLSGSINISGNTTLTGSLTALNLTASFGYVSASFLDITGKQTVRGYTQYIPTSDVIPIATVGGYIYASGSQGDLYFGQTNGSLVNTVKLRWLEGNMYSGLLNGGVISTASSTVYTVSSGSGLIVSMNGSLSADPYPTIQYINWGNLSASIAPLSASYDQQYVAINSSGQIYAQGTPFVDGQFSTLITVGLVLHQNRSTINLVKTIPSLAYGSQQDYNIFSRAFGSLKLSGFTVAVSGSSTGSIVLGSGTSYAPGANYITDQNNTSYVTDPGTTVSKIWRYYDSSSYTEWKYDTNGGVGYPTIDPTQYNPGGLGVLDTVGTGNYSLQRVFWFPNSVSKAFVVYYGNNRYGNLDDAVLNANVENFVEAPNTAANAIYLGTFAIKGGTNTSLQNPLHFRWIPGGLFRNVGGNGGGGSVVTQTLAGLSDVSIVGPTNGQPLVYNSTTLKWENKSILTGSLFGTASYATTASYVNGNIFTNSNSALSASYAVTSSWAVSASWAPVQVSSSYALTASYAPLYLPLTGGTISGNVTVNGTASIAFLNVLYESASVIYSSGSNVFGDAVDDTQTLNGTVLVSGSQQITGSLNVSQGITGSLFGTASYALTASYLNGGTNGFIQNGNSFGTTATLGTNDNQSLAFETSGSTRMFISSSGNVGIGTTTPSQKLEVNGNALIKTAFIGTVSAFGDNYTSFSHISRTGSDDYSLLSDNSGITYLNAKSSQNIRFRINNIDRAILDSSGNFGIATLTPNAPLDVNGNAIVTGSLSVGISTILAARIAASTAGANTVFTQATGSFTAAKYLYTVTSASNARTGEVMAVWNGTSVQYTDNSTLDIGSTTAVTASVSIVTSQAQFNMQTTNAGWTIKSQVTYL